MWVGPARRSQRFVCQCGVGRQDLFEGEWFGAMGNPNGGEVNGDAGDPGDGPDLLSGADLQAAFAAHDGLEQGKGSARPTATACGYSAVKAERKASAGPKRRGRKSKYGRVGRSGSLLVPRAD